MDFTQLRLRGLFDPSSLMNPPDVGPPSAMSMPSFVSTPQIVQSPQVIGQEPDKIGQWMNELYHPETQASDRLNQMISNYPQRPNPGILSRIAASLAGAAVSGIGPYDKFNAPQAIGLGQQALQRPFLQKQEDWEKQIKPIEQAANIERQGNVNERTAAYNVISSRLRDEAQDARARNDERKAQIAESRAEVYRLKSLNDFTFDFKGTTVKAANKRTGQITDTGIPTNHLSDVDKLALGHEYRTDEIRTRGEEQRQTQAEKPPTGNQGWQLGKAPDPNDPTKEIAVRINTATGEVEPITFQGKTGPLAKSGTNLPDAGKLQAVQDRARETLNVLDQLLDVEKDSKTGQETGNVKLKGNIKTAVGASRMMGLQYLPATETREADATIKQLKSKLIVDLIGEMKAQSKTGATGFGQLNIRELSVLEQAASKLDPSLSEEAFTTELNRIRERLKKILQPNSALSPTTTTKPKMTPAELLKKYGGE